MVALKRMEISAADIARADLVHQALDQGRYGVTLPNGQSITFSGDEVNKWPVLKQMLVDGIRRALTNALIVGHSGKGYGIYIADMCDVDVGSVFRLSDFFHRGLFMTRQNRAFAVAEQRSLLDGNLDHQVSRLMRAVHYYRTAAEGLWGLLDGIDSQDPATEHRAARRNEFLRREEDGRLVLTEDPVQMGDLLKMLRSEQELP